MTLRDAGPFDVAYATDTHDIAREFFNPCLANSSSYDRITGFFSSSVYVLTWPALRTFVTGSGRVRILCSPMLQAGDVDQIERGYIARSDAALSDSLRQELDAMLAEERTGSHARLLAALIANGHVEIRLATVSANGDAATRRMFHDKVGIFLDEAGDAVGFGGSMNETLNGLQRNVESVTVWPSWSGDRDAQRVRDARARFDRLWAGSVAGVTVHELPAGLREVVEVVAEDVDLDEELERLMQSGAPDPVRLTLRPHQRRAVNRWVDKDMVGLLAHATGSGKTYTGLQCIELAIDRGLTPIVVAPSTLLLNQWSVQVRDVLGRRALHCGAGHTSWRDENLLRAAVDSDGEHVVVTTAHTAWSPRFLGQLRNRGGKLALIADEVHRLGSPTFSTLLDRVPAAARLGLSATPERHGDPEGTERIMDYFGGVIDRYSLEDAVRDGWLSPYEYDVTIAHLTEQEQDAWDELTTRIKRAHAIARSTSGTDDRAGAAERLQRLLIQRARIVKTAAVKPRLTARTVADHLEAEDRWLVYCDNVDQLEETIDELRAVGVSAQRYYTSMDDDKDQVLTHFKKSGGVLVSIRCLDEGVDIPAADHALLVASSQNPREHIQRRGRVLREAPGKSAAKVIDIVTVPRTVDDGDESWKIVVSEIARATAFDAASETPGPAQTKLRRAWAELGLSLDELDDHLADLAAAGIESPEDAR